MSGSSFPFSDDTHRFLHDDGYFYQYPQSLGEVELRKKSFAESSRFQGPRYERRKKQRAENRDETYDPEKDPEVIERRHGQAEKDEEIKRKVIAEGKRTKKTCCKRKKTTSKCGFQCSFNHKRSTTRGSTRNTRDNPREARNSSRGA